VIFTVADQEQFRRDGFVVARGVVPPRNVAAARAAICCSRTAAAATTRIVRG
jgi:hypothetical protein